jgi:hypothetical protein
MGKLDGKIDAVFADMDMPQHPGAALLVIDHETPSRTGYGASNRCRATIAPHEAGDIASPNNLPPGYCPLRGRDLET